MFDSVSFYLDIQMDWAIMCMVITFKKSSVHLTDSWCESVAKQKQVDECQCQTVLLTRWTHLHHLGVLVLVSNTAGNVTSKLSENSSHTHFEIHIAGS